MSITFYHSSLCPRCALVKSHLASLLGDDLDSIINSVELLRYPFRTWKDGIRMVPALKSDDETLSGIMLSRQEIARFLWRNSIETQEEIFE